MAEIEFSLDAIAAQLHDSMADSNELQSQCILIINQSQNKAVENSTSSNLKANVPIQPINMLNEIKPTPMTYEKWFFKFNNCKETNDRMMDLFRTEYAIRKENQMNYQGFPEWSREYIQQHYQAYVQEFRAQTKFEEQQQKKYPSLQRLSKEPQELYRLGPQFQSSGQRKQN